MISSLQGKKAQRGSNPGRTFGDFVQTPVPTRLFGQRRNFKYLDNILLKLPPSFATWSPRTLCVRFYISNMVH